MHGLAASLSMQRPWWLPKPEALGLPKPEALGFKTVSVVCVPCGERWALEELDWSEFVRLHGAHVRDFLERHYSPKPTWRRDWRKR